MELISSVAYQASLRDLLGQRQVTYLRLELLPNYAHAIAHLVPHGMHLSYEISSYFAHFRLYLCTYVTVQFCGDGTYFTFQRTLSCT
jgi:hypothetical protein